jgi:hypothetical protein
VQLRAVALHIRKMKISPSVYLAHAKTLENGMAKYPLRRVICKTFTIPSGYLDVTHEKLFTGQFTSRLVVGCVDKHAFNGDYAENPFSFQHFSLDEIMVYLDGQQHGIKPLTMNFGNGHYVSAFMTLFSGTGKTIKDEETTVTDRISPTDTLSMHSTCRKIYRKMITVI